MEPREQGSGLDALMCESGSDHEQGSRNHRRNLFLMDISKPYGFVRIFEISSFLLLVIALFNLITTNLFHAHVLYSL